MTHNEKLIIADKVKEFIYFTDEILTNYPRKYYLLKDKIENTLYEILELIYYTNAMEEKESYQKKLLSKILC